MRLFGVGQMVQTGERTQTDKRTDATKYIIPFALQSIMTKYPGRNDIPNNGLTFQLSVLINAQTLPNILPPCFSKPICSIIVGI